jgi:tetratricopeptide (TPR) repeat protein/precorrin-6B methylase 2
MSILSRLISARPSPRAVPKGGATQPSDENVAQVLRDIVALGNGGRFAEAHDLASRALECAPDHPDLLFAKATGLLDTGRFAEARALYERLENEGMEAPALAVQLATACRRLGDDAAGEAALRRAVALHPSEFSLRYALGSLLQASNRLNQAIPELEAAIGSDPIHVTAQLAYGNALMDLRRYAEAEVAYRRAADLQPQSAAARTNIGFALMRQDRNDEAMAEFERAFGLEASYGGDADAFTNFTAALGDDGRDAEAISVFEQCLALRPAPKAQFNYAMSLLRSGRFREGWCQQESRWMFEPFRSLRPAYGLPTWSGQSLRGKTIVVRAEQGLGDTIHMLRYVPALAALGARVMLRAPPGFERLGLAVDGMAEVLAQGTVNPPFDFYVQAMSLPGIFGTTVENIPNDVPYLGVEPERRERWSRRLGTRARPRVGLVWAGSPTHLRDRYRSVELEALSGMIANRDVQFVSLQKGPAAEALGSFEERGNVIDLGPEIQDLADTAAILEQLDLTIGVDTAVMHLAGALARPAWMMIPLPCDWRWLADRDDSPWYPMLRIYRQSKRMRWDDVIARITDDLATWVSSPPPPPASVVPVKGANVARLLQARMAPARTVAVPGICGVTETRWGIVQYPEDGSDRAASIALLGEWLELQIRPLCRMFKPDAVVLEAGAGEGIHTLAFATVLKEGRVYACEPREPLQRLLKQNVEANGRTNVAVAAIDPSRVTDAPAESIDAMRLEPLHLIKVGVPEWSLSVLQGCADTLWRARPVLLLAAADAGHVATLANHVEQFGYRRWHMNVPLFNPDNFSRRESGAFMADGRAMALLAIPEETDVDMELTGCTLMG